MAIDMWVENFSLAVLKALAASTLKRRPRGDQRSPIPSGIQDEVRLKNRLQGQWQVTKDSTLRTEINRLQSSVTRRHKERRNDQWNATLEFLDLEDLSLWRMAKRVMRVPTPSPSVHPEGTAILDSEKTEALADNLETQFQPVTEPLVTAVIEIVLTLRSYFLTSASEPKLTNPDEVHESIRGHKIGRLLAQTVYRTEP
jgi:hypothetical protein